MIHFNSKATPINNTNYSCHNYKSCRTYLTNYIGSISFHIMLLVINSLRGGHTYMQTHTHAHTDFLDKSNFKKPGVSDKGQRVPGLASQRLLALNGQIALFHLYLRL